MQQYIACSNHCNCGMVKFIVNAALWLVKKFSSFTYELSLLTAGTTFRSDSNICVRLYDTCDQLWYSPVQCDPTVNVHMVRCIPPTSRWFPPGTPVSSTIAIQTVCICPRGPLGRLAFMLKVSPSLNKVDYY
jgi:hypothetical protein